MLIPSQERKNMTGGLPGSVIPEFVADQTGTWVSLPMNVNTVYFAKSAFFEVKAVTAPITPSTSNWQILGLLDGARTWPASCVLIRARWSLLWSRRSCR